MKFIYIYLLTTFISLSYALELTPINSFGLDCIIEKKIYQLESSIRKNQDKVLLSVKVTPSFEKDWAVLIAFQNKSYTLIYLTLDDENQVIQFKKPIKNKRLVKKIHRIWQAEIKASKYLYFPYRIILDGANYRYSTFALGYGDIRGEVSAPEKGTLLKMSQITELLKSLIKNPTEENLNLKELEKLLDTVYKPWHKYLFKELYEKWT